MPELLSTETKPDVNPDFNMVVGRVSAGVLETMFFEEAVETECEHAWLETAISAQVGFNGSHDGSFLLSISPTAAWAIAAGFLGLDPEELSEGQSGQVILELSNILCGAVLSNLWPESSLSLGTPVLTPAHQPAPDSMHRCFLLPDGPVAVSIQVRS